MSSPRNIIQRANERLEILKALQADPMAHAADIASRTNLPVSLVRKMQRDIAAGLEDKAERIAQDLQRSMVVQAELLEAEAVRRAYEGVDEPVFYQGSECGEVRKYSDTLLMFLLKGMMPNKYRERVDQTLSNPDGSPIALQVTYVQPPNKAD